MPHENLAAMIRTAADRYGERVALRHRSRDGAWTAVSYAELGRRIEAFASSLLELGVAAGDRVGILSQNRPEWAIADFAIQSVGAISVPIYATSPEGQIRYIVEDAGLRLLVTGDGDDYGRALSVREAAGAPERIVVCDPDVAPAEGDLSFAGLEERGRLAPRADEVAARTAAVGPDDVATIVYTSGTTGDPKGVMLSHGNFAHQFRALDRWFHVDGRDRSLCFLPLSHVYERAWSYYVYRQGVQNYHLSDPRQVVRYLADVRPTVMVSAPRLYEKVHAAVLDRLSRASTLRQRIFRWAMGIGERHHGARCAGRRIDPWLRLRHAVADRLVLRRIRDLMGGPKNFISAGGAGMAEDIEHMFFAAGILVCRGYGLTETAPMVTANCPASFRFGTVGRVVHGCEVRIAEDGEILVRGPNVMKGYWNKPAETAAAFRDGWLRTGDVGELDADGYLTITDRIKDLIITSGGKNVAPQKIEVMVGRDHYIEQIAVVGEGRKFVAALIVPFYEALEDLARRRGWRFRSRSELLSRAEVVRFFKERIEKHSNELAGFERIRRFALVPSAFSQELGEITPTLKVRRAAIAARYAQLIDRMYV